MGINQSDDRLKIKSALILNVYQSPILILNVFIVEINIQVVNIVGDDAHCK